MRVLLAAYVAPGSAAALKDAPMDALRGGNVHRGGPPGRAPAMGGEYAYREGYGGGGSGGPSIGIAHADDEQLSLDRVTFEIGPGGPGGIADVEDETRDKANRGSDSFAAE